MQAYNQQRPLREFCKKNNISITSYSTLGAYDSSLRSSNTDKFPKLLDHPVVKSIASNRSKSTAQILLRHLLQEGVIVIPKSIHAERIKSNIDIFDFELSDDEMKQLNALDKLESGRIFNYLAFKG